MHPKLEIPVFLLLRGIVVPSKYAVRLWRLRSLESASQLLDHHDDDAHNHDHYAFCREHDDDHHYDQFHDEHDGRHYLDHHDDSAADDHHELRSDDEHRDHDDAAESQLLQLPGRQLCQRPPRQPEHL